MRNHKLWWQSSYDRGLDHLLLMWPEVLKKYPEAELHICYGWDTFDAIVGNNAERLTWKENINKAMEQKGVFHYGRIGKAQMESIRKECGILAYPTHFTEIFMISMIEAQASGLVPVTMDLAALREVVGGGVLLKGGISKKETQQAYLKELLALMGDSKRWNKESKKVKDFAKQFTWEKTAKAWTDEFERKDSQDLKVTVYTPTIRKGWWNLMADNLKRQTYKNLEWIIVDDFPEDRAKIAQKYAKSSGLDIKYYRGKERKIKRNYALVNADNTAMQVAQGELLVFLQDFILIEPTAIEELVNLHRKNPDALLAPCDIYYHPKVKPDVDKEDWFNGETDVKGEFAWANPRIQGIGLRETNNPFEFEMNWGAIPTKVMRDLGGFWEFFDFGLGFNNTSIAYSALKAGYRIIVDDNNVATCIDHWEALKGKEENGGMERGRRLNDPLFLWYKEMIDQARLPIFRRQEIDDRIDLQYDVPKDMSDEEFTKVWLPANGARIANDWLKEYDDFKI